MEALVAKYRNYVSEHTPMFFNGDENVPRIPDACSDEQLISTLYISVASENADKEIINILERYTNSFHKDALSEEEYTFLSDHFKEVISFEFEHRNEWVFGDSYRFVSEEKCRLIKEIFKPQKNLTVFIANTEYCDLAVHFPDCTIKGYTSCTNQKKEWWAFGQIRLFAAGIKSEIVHGEFVNTGEYEEWSWDDEDDSKVKEIYTIEKKILVHQLPEKESVDFAFWGACSKLSYYRSHCNVRVEDLYDILKPGGTLFLFSDEMTEMIGDDDLDFAMFRNRIIREKSLASIVAYDDESKYSFTSKKKVTHTLLVITKKNHESVFLKNEKKGSETIIPIGQIHSNIFWADYYLTDRPSNGIPLSSLSKLTIDDHSKLGETIHDFDNERVKIVLPEEVMSMSCLYPMDFGIDYKDADLLTKDLLSVSEIINNNKWIPENDFLSNYHLDWGTKVEKPCVLLFGKEEKMKVGYLYGQDISNFLRFKHVVPCLIPNEGIDVRYLAALLFLPEVKQQIVAFCEGTSYDTKTLSLILDKIIVPQHNEKERIQFLAEANYKAWKATQVEMRKDHSNYIKAVRMRKHALTQSLSSVRSMMNALNNYRIKKNGLLSDNDCISRIKNTSVKDAFDFLTDNINGMMPIIEHIADIEYSFGKTESFDIETYISDYISNHKKGWTNFKAITTWSKFSQSSQTSAFVDTHGKEIQKKEKAEKMLHFPKKALERILDDIISNAQSHAFTNNKRKDYQLVFSWQNDGLNLNIEIKNNGNPIPEDHDVQSLLEYGVSTSLNKDGHNGIGCHEIEEIMNRYQGHVQLISTPNDEFTVKYILSFHSNVLAC